MNAHTQRIKKISLIASIIASFVLIGTILLGQVACSQTQTQSNGTPRPSESVETQNEGGLDQAQSANLIARSDNTLSSQEKEMVLKEISDELDYIMNVVQSLDLPDTDSDHDEGKRR